jgi:site-specific DNA recombinase
MVEVKIQKVVGYARVSTEEQIDNTSLEDQQKRIEAYAISKGWKLDKLFIEQGSGSSIEGRPVYREMIQYAIDNDIDAIVVLKADRIHRSLKNLLVMIEDELEPQKKAFVSVEQSFDTSTAQGMLFLQMLGSFAEFERKQITQRMKSGRVATAKAGEYAGGGAPYGYKVINGSLVVDPETSAIVKEIFRSYLNGKSLQSVADDLNDKQIPTKNGKPWSKQSVAYVLGNETYLGEVHYHGDKEQNEIKTQGKHEAIINKVVFGKVQAQLSKRAKRKL